MRLLRIGNTKVDIDNKTAFGVTYQSYDIKQPAQPKINISNTFSIPKTNSNLAIFGFIDNPQSISTIPYEELLCNYWINNEHILKDARVRLESVDSRINLFIYEKLNIWDLLKTFTWQTFASELLTWLQDERGYASITSPDIGNIITNSGIIDNTEELFLPYYIGNLEKDNTNLDFINLGSTTENGGHLCVYVKTIFEFLEYKYSVNFGTAGGIFTANLWDDAVAEKIYIPIRDIAIKLDNPAYFYISTAPFLPYSEELKDKGDKTAYDLVTAFFKHFNVLVDYLTISEVDYIALRRFDDIETDAEVTNFSNKINKVNSFKNKIEGYAQNNRIVFSTVFAENNEFSNSKVLTSSNVNLDVNKELFSIDAYVNGITENSDSEFIALLTEENAIKNFSFLISTTKTISDINISNVAFPPSTNSITENFINVDLTTFVSSVTGATNSGTSSTLGTYARSNVKTVLTDNYISLTWTTISGFTDFSIDIYDVVNAVTLSTALLTSQSLNYTMLVDTDIQIRIVRKAGLATPKSFSITDLTGLTFDYQPSTNNSKLFISNLYDLSSEYNFLDEIINYPRVYNVDMWLNVADIRNLEYFKQYYVKQLNGSFFLSKIEGFNPTKKLPTTVELIKISDKTPPPISTFDFWVDGIDDPFTDGFNDEFF